MPQIDQQKPLVFITGAGGAVGTALVEALEPDYRVVGFDRSADDTDPCEMVEGDLTDDASMELAFRKLKERHGSKIASVIHLAAYFDFTGEKSPLYDEVNVEGTRRLLRHLQEFDVEQFVYSGTMLIHEAGDVGERIDEDTPVSPDWAYPQSKAEAEKVIREERGGIKTVRLHLAGLYDDETAVPTLTQQIARIYERDIKSHVYAGNLDAGQAFIHADDMRDAMRRVVDRRAELPDDCAILVGEPQPMGYRALQNRIGALIHGEDTWRTISLPKPLAKVGAWIETRAEPVIPDALDEGEAPFIRPFMIDLASDHFSLDIDRARELLDWEPEHHISDGLEKIVANLKSDPPGWYRANKIRLPIWMRSAEERVDDPDKLRQDYEAEVQWRHRQGLWAHWVNAGLGVWLLTSPPLLGYNHVGMILSDMVAGTVLIVASLLALSWRNGLARWVAAAVGVWVMFAPLLFWTENGAGYLNATLIGMLIPILALAVGPPPGVSPTALMTGPTIPKGWSYSPSDWFQRIPVIILAIVGLLISRYLTAYQLETIDGVWDPFFPGTEPGKNGSESVVTSSVSESWPVPDAGLGALTYALEIVVGVIGSSRRWRTMPWLTVIFGIMIVPLGAVSIFFIVIQPILIGTYCALCLVAAAAMLIQIPYSVDELVATGQFLRRRHRAGQPWLKVFFLGDTDEGPDDQSEDDFNRPPKVIIKEMLSGGMTFPWTLGASMALAVLLMLSPLLIGWDNGLAAVNHVVGALVLTVSAAALAAVARLARFLNVLLGVVLLFAPFMTGAGFGLLLVEALFGLALIALSIPRGDVGNSTYGSWQRFVR
ncbi:hypothetical protein OG2516_11221 [Oceanicola granulosus HTCC2516]|uniref:DNA polymerase III subunit epsilon n=1 Tax=Oceanicola granulosus (strain ATCC BAA-861 / DSM 15982 / KCTC 12143 / HTCC2516) TaxID=314256 RepID=Q2CJV9_OCEGH|nr:vitamin K epoxide reductase family protein [Oceanicola granulosus]EAR53030.1 hypothetical protein OG2516_11221 [Oceanicola granulosus HTCC2516]